MNVLRPCRLQVNTAGAWRNVMDFDASEGDAVMEHAAHLFSICPTATLRIMSAGTSDTAPLMTWSRGEGWHKFWKAAAL